VYWFSLKLESYTNGCNSGAVDIVDGAGAIGVAPCGGVALACGVIAPACGGIAIA